MLKQAIFVILLAFGLYFLRVHLKGTKCTLQNELKSKTVLITGANSGTGFETSVELARRGANLIMACRKARMCEEAAARVRTLTQSRTVTTTELDLSSLSSVAQFARRMQSEVFRLHVLILNAGVMAIPTWQATKEGLELQLGVNHVGHFAVARALLPMLSRSRPARVIVVSSAAHEFGDLLHPRSPAASSTASPASPPSFSLDAASYSGWAAYSRSKLANVLFAREAARRWGPTHNLTVVSLHPGSFHSNLQRHLYTSVQKALEWLSSVMMKDAREGSQTTICCALDPELQTHNGVYFEETRPSSSWNAQARNDTLAAELWDWTENFVRPHF